MRGMSPLVALIVLGVVVTFVCLAGCDTLPKIGGDARVSHDVEPETGAKYYLAVPSKHTPQKQWALIITCHGTPPWDTAIQQIGKWSEVVESKGVIVAAPVLKGTASDRLFPIVKDQIKKQTHDEKVILSIVERLQPAYNIDPSRIFITGWSGGGYAVLYTGLRHPEVFRALAVHQGNFDRRFVEATKPYLDTYQPVQISYGVTDLLKSQAEDAITWLREQRMSYAIPQELSGTHRLLPEVAYQFFQRCVREYPWIIVTATAARSDQLMSVKFQVRSAPEAAAYLWNFGDGSISKEPSPGHLYSNPGTYKVQLTLKTKAGTQHVRTVQVTVPVARIGVAGGAQ